MGGGVGSLFFSSKHYQPEARPEAPQFNCDAVPEYSFDHNSISILVFSQCLGRECASIVPVSAWVHFNCIAHFVCEQFNTLEGQNGEYHRRHPTHLWCGVCRIDIEGNTIVQNNAWWRHCNSCCLLRSDAEYKVIQHSSQRYFPLEIKCVGIGEDPMKPFILIQCSLRNRNGEYQTPLLLPVLLILLGKPFD